MENKLLSKEQYNYMRLVNLVLCKGKEVVQRTFDAEFHPKELHNELKRSLSKLQKLYKKVIKENQWQLLFPNSGKPVSDRFDISLMITLLRNLTDEYSIQDKLPTASDVTVSADLSRIKYYRNTLLHSDDAELSETEFEMKWIDLTEAIIRLGGNDFKHQCSALKEAILNSSVIDLINEVRNDLRSPTLPEGIKVIQSTLIKEFEECEDLIVDTRACKHGIELVNSKDVVIVTGPPGSGKSTILGHICLALHRQGYIVIPCRTPDEIINFYNSDNKQLFLYDDVVGPYAADVNLLRTWQKYSADLKKLIDKKTCKLLIAARSYIYNDRGFSLVPLFNNTDFAATLDLLSQNVSLTNRERFQIAEKYIGEDGLRILRKQNLLDKYSFFPLLCKLYHRLQKNLKSCVKIFFSSPTDMMLKELKGFYESDQTVIAVLFIFVALNNKINIDEIPSDNFKELLRNVGEDFETCFPLTRVLKSQLDRLTNTYVTKSMNSYSLVHETLFDILVFFYGTYKLDLLIEYGHTIVIRDRFNIEHTGHDVKNITELDVKISTEMKQKYFVRLKDEILTKSEREVFSNTQWKCLDCLSSFIEYMTTCPDIVEYLRSLSDSVDSPLFVAIEQSLDPLVQRIKRKRTRKQRCYTSVYCAFNRESEMHSYVTLL